MFKKFLLTLFAFITISLVTSTFQSSSDGYDIIGFPLVFYKNLGGKCIDCTDTNFFKIHHLIIDFIFVAIIVYTLLFICKGVKQK